jgi:hypothetical protein
MGVEYREQDRGATHSQACLDVLSSLTAKPYSGKWSLLGFTSPNTCIERDAAKSAAPVKQNIIQLLDIVTLCILDSNNWEVSDSSDFFLDLC